MVSWRAGLVAVIVLVAVVLVGLFGPSVDRDDRPTEPPAPTTGPSVTASPAGSVQLDATETTRRYLAAFFDKAGTTAGWHERIDRYSTPILADLNTTVPRSSVPAARPVRVWVTGLKATYADAHARLSDGTVLLIGLERSADEWRVSEVAPIR